jgi:hypothetical protein
MWHRLKPGQEVSSNVPKGSLSGHGCFVDVSGKRIKQQGTGERRPSLRTIYLTETWRDQQSL